MGEWLRVAPESIDQPPGFMTVPSGITQGCAPCHPAVDTTMTGVAAGPSGLVAVGWIFQGFHGVAWHSSDGATWTLDAPLPERTVLEAVAGDERVYVAVGRHGEGSTAWYSKDGVDWTETPSTNAFGASLLRLTAVVHWPQGFVATGYEGAESGSARAAFWVSRDGITWARATAAGDLGDARPVALTTGGPGLVAVGMSGSSSNAGHAAIWTSPDGLSWSRVQDSSVFAGGRMRTVTNSPSIGLVASGETLAGDLGVVWLSRDGLHWRRLGPVAGVGATGTQVRVYASTGTRAGALLLGTANEGVQYGEAAVWSSDDGVSWTRTGWGAEFADAELTAVTAYRGRLYAVGDRGAPDTYIATVWSSPDDWAP